MIQERKITSEQESEINGKIEGMYFLLQSNTEKFLEELDRSYQLFKIGEKTEITKRLEEIAAGRRIGSMETELIEKLLGTLNLLGKKVVIEGFLKNSDDLEVAYLLSENESRMLFGLVPKDGREDQLRLSISKFYSQTSNWEMFRFTEPLFQVIPKSLIESIKQKSQINYPAG